ncbi:MAG: hypothetical protein MZU95_16660 [Desulfomicrobium escambiense]|nr:hypothetical protein [Desulfomicrobium escambiense]
MLEVFDASGGSLLWRGMKPNGLSGSGPPLWESFQAEVAKAEKRAEEALSGAARPGRCQPLPAGSRRPGGTRMQRSRAIVGLVFLIFFVISFLTNILGPLVPDIISAFSGAVDSVCSRLFNLSNT